MLHANDEMAKQCGRCGHSKLVHQKGHGPCRAYTCDGLRMCIRFVEASTTIG